MNDLRHAEFREVFALFAIPGAIGAIAGAIGAPLVGFGLLRRVPLGRSILFTASGAIVGASLGEWIRPWNPYSRAVPGVILGALLGFLVAGIALRLWAGLRSGT